MRMPGSAASRRRASVVLPAPDGDDRTSSIPLRAMRGPSLTSPLLNVLDLLAHLIDHRFELETGPRRLRVARLGAQGVGLAVELLGQEVEPATGRLAAVEQLARRRDVRGEALQFLLHVGAGRQQRGLLVETRLVEAGARFQEPPDLLLEPLA